MNTVLVSLVQCFHNVCQDRRILSTMVSKMEIQGATSKITRRTFTTRSAYRDAIPWLKKLSLSDRIVNFRFEDVEEAFFADLLAGFGTLEDCAGFGAEGAEFGSHGGLIAVRWLEVLGRVIERRRKEFGS